MSIAAEFAAFVEGAQTARGPRCSVGSLPPSLRQLVEDADATVTHSVISKFLVSKGHKVRAFTVSRHRRGECSCA